MSYKQMRADHEYIWKTYGGAYDMTGAYVDQHDLWKLLKNPTKATAEDCYHNQLRYFFQTGIDPSDLNRCNITIEDVKNDPKIIEIANRLGMLYELDVLRSN